LGFCYRLDSADENQWDVVNASFACGGGPWSSKSDRACHLDSHASARRSMASACSGVSPVPVGALRRHDPRQEPDAVVPPVRICGGGEGRPLSLLRLRKKCRLDAHPGVPDGDLRCGTRLHQPNVHAAPFGRELQGIGQQVPQDLLHASRVAQNRADRLDVGLQPDVFCAGGRLERVQTGGRQGSQIDGVDASSRNFPLII
jgi:hypothetical protein